MLYRSSTCAFALAALMVTMGCVRAADDPKYPNWKGQWSAIVTPGLEGTQFKFDPTKAAWGPEPALWNFQVHARARGAVLGDAFGSVAIRLVTDVVIWARECGAFHPIAAGVCKKGKGWTAAIRGVSGTRRRNRWRTLHRVMVRAPV